MSRVRPILFNTDMVRAILDGRKTVTRRRIDIDIANNCDMERDGMLLDYQDEYGNFINPVKLCRYQPGDILYVRETWGEWTGGYIYKAWNEPFPQPGCYPGMKWRPSIHMPKEAARIWLKVTDVKVELLRDISEEQVRAEGIHFCESPDVSGWTWKDEADIKCCKFGMFSAFKALWNSTIKDKDRNLYAFKANPFVWVIEFERCEKPGRDDKSE